MIRPEKAPYATTKIDARRSQADIDALLEKYGIRDTIWSRQGDQTTLSFVTSVEIDGKSTELGFKFNPPPFFLKRKTWSKEKGRYEELNLPNHAQGMRILHDYLKLKLAAVAWGLRPFEEEFMAEVLIPQPEGLTRFAEVVKKRGLLSLPEVVTEKSQVISDT